MSQPAPVPDANEFWTPRRFLLVLAAVVLAVFPKVALGLTTFFFRDSGALGFPGAFYFQQSILDGELPLWNPYSHCGVPFLAQMGQWYPVNWLCAVLPMPWSLNFALFLHLLLGGWGMYALARRWGADGFAASFAGLAFAFNGVSFSCFQWSNYIASLGWLPWVVLAVTEAWRNGGRWLALAAIVSALQVLTATPELTLLGWLFLAALWLAELFSGNIKFWSSARRVALVILLAAGLTMIQMLPFFDLLGHARLGLGQSHCSAVSQLSLATRQLVSERPGFSDVILSRPRGHGVGGRRSLVHAHPRQPRHCRNRLGLLGAGPRRSRTSLPHRQKSFSVDRHRAVSGQVHHFDCVSDPAARSLVYSKNPSRCRHPCPAQSYFYQWSFFNTPHRISHLRAEKSVSVRRRQCHDVECHRPRRFAGGIAGRAVDTGKIKSAAPATGGSIHRAWNFAG